MGFIDYYFKGKEKITEEDIKLFISQQIEENKNLDYKEIQIFDNTDKLSVIISSFANTEGGSLILGISENEIQDEKGNIVRIYPKEPTWGNLSLDKESLENKIISKISPPIDGLEIQPVRNDKNDKNIFLIDVPKSANAPHMSFDNRYHGRLNFRTIPLEHHQVSSLFQINWIMKEKITNEIIAS